MATTMTEIPIKDLALTTAPAGKQLLVRDASAGLQRIDYAQIAIPQYPLVSTLLPYSRRVFLFQERKVI